MNLRQRAMIIVCATFLVLFVLLHALSRGIIQETIDLLERRDMEANLARVQKALAHDLQNLSAVAADWALWDDTYFFLQGKNEAYIESNLTPQSIGALHLDLFVLFDAAGKPVLARSYDQAEGVVSDVPETVTAALAGLPVLLGTDQQGVRRSGILLLDGVPCLVAAQTVLTSARQGPRAGILVMGQYLDATRVKALSDLTLLPVRVLPLSTPEAPRPLVARIEAALREDVLEVNILNRDTVVGFFPVRDITGQPVALLSVAMPRTIHNQGLAMERANIVALIVVGLIFGLAMLYFTQKYIVARVTGLGDELKDLGHGGRARVTELTGRDEIAALSRAVNAMLDELEGARSRYALATSAANVGVWELRVADGTLTVDPVIARQLGFDPSPTGLPLSDWLARIHPDDRERVRRESLAGWAEDEPARESEFRVLTEGAECRWFLTRGKAIGSAAGQGTVVGTAVDVTELKRATENIRALTGQLIAAQESERTRIARDLHDNVAQDLSTLKISFETLLDRKPGADPALRERLDALAGLLGRCIGSVRDLALTLRPPDLEYLGLAKSLRRLCEDFMAASGLATSFTAVGLERIAPDHDVAINLYRIAQEALSNARRHSDASSVSVRLMESHPRLILRVADDGQGFDPDQVPTDETGRRRMGLVNMRERAALFGGSLRVVSGPGQGTTIVAAIPYVQEGKSVEATSAHR
jgi:signal transduction histidine kinase